MDDAADTLARRRSGGWRRVATIRRFLMTVFVVGQTLVACYFLLWVLPYHGGTLVELGLLVLFALLYMWIAVGFWTAVLGFVLRLVGGDRYSLLKRYEGEALEATPLARTAIIMPVYHEPVYWTLSGLKAVYRDLERSGHLDQFEFHILSDSRDPNVWLEEQATWYRLCQELGAEGRLFYRRRRVNLNFKSGNVADFLRRWGRRYRYMVVLDADSLLSADTIVRMVQLMEREPNVGILQTAPSLINGESLFARVQQFSNRLYSALFATGLAAIQMGDAAFWGHNAIIRIKPFMAHCGLRKLRGFGLFRGPIMSHDFVEAAYMGRAGYEVWLEPGLSNSFEESPPTLSDELSRDNRWSRGNLQHLWILLFGRRLRLAHRMALLNGVMAYMASPLWLGFLILTTVEAVQMTVASIDYFPEGHQGLFPLWPEWRPEWALGLALSTLSLLFIPKFLAILDAVIHGTSRQFGGVVRLFVSVLVEIVVSVLLAPVRMIAHSQYVLGALLNVSLTWAGQNRTQETSWREALVTQFPGMLVAAGWSAFAWSLDPMFFLWSLPVAIPLLLAAPTSVLLSKVSAGQALRKLGMLVIPEERESVQVLDDARAARSDSRNASMLTAVEEAVVRPRLNRLHQALARDVRLAKREELLVPLVEHCGTAGPDSLSRSELSQLFRDRQSLAELHERAWQAPIDSFWGRRIAILSRKGRKRRTRSA
ncbi:glucans biosynthesis glucosyltransferase MdoH [Marinobacter panjinensis]|uniref:Glucans biosynthesis glucosyltransferase H n=2 Tax=Marinobacter panjinensis TaxID=2576384 RepID=A0A4U6R996_9GAMM|nr:glucans biosynthesis glucosyltransferase MdoH [Marinobacter panjinensis]MCR8915785.1 glucans biosynthesis glucosyltransferase MdoH [Marinobacter panjinensis]TKV69602.1 glucans biosynthesis glucosyltransferase MdoH [Marinobacter panjinensis]